MRQMQHIANIKFTVERTGSKFVPYGVHLNDFKMIMKGRDIYHVMQEELRLVETDQIELPESVKSMALESTAEIECEFWGCWFNYETDCGTEYDAEFEFRNEKVKITP